MREAAVKLAERELQAKVWSHSIRLGGENLCFRWRSWPELDLVSLPASVGMKHFNPFLYSSAVFAAEQSLVFFRAPWGNSHVRDSGGRNEVVDNLCLSILMYYSAARERWRQVELRGDGRDSPCCHSSNQTLHQAQHRLQPGVLLQLPWVTWTNCKVDLMWLD